MSEHPILSVRSSVAGDSKYGCPGIWIPCQVTPPSKPPHPLNVLPVKTTTFCRAMLRRARLCHSMSSVRPSVCLSVTFRYRDHTSWNTSKIISPMISLGFILELTPTWAIWSNWITPKITVE